MSNQLNIDSIFCSAVEIESPQEREAFLKQACGGDAQLARQVERLLDAHFHGGSVLDSPANGLVATIHQPVTERPGDAIGPYKLLQQIGEGGFGVVYMAEQTEPIRRRVALKIVKPGMDSRQIIARFEAERQALALMDHVNVAKVLDAGTSESNRPYFVMELVKGVPITQYCDANHVAIRQRLALFIQVCHAVQHAHHKGVIHRDLKPSNILVAEYDEQPVPKVIDFGVAKALYQPLTESTMFTQFGQIIGTLDYMSPEQAKLNQLDVDTRSDIYSLGVVLYELLTGMTPFDKQRLRSAGIDEVLRIIAEEEAPTPSTRVSHSDTLPDLAARRGVEPARLGRILRGDLDWITLKALEKDRNRRYQTAAGLADDIRRHLDDLPIEARRPTVLGRARRFVRRKRIPVALGTCAAIALAVAAVFATLAHGGRRAAHIAMADLHAKQQARDFDIPLLRRLVDGSQLVAAFQLARRIDEVLPDDPVKKELENELLTVGDVVSEPAGARVRIRDWNAQDGPWLEIGTTPLENVSLPRGELRWKFVKDGYVPRELQQPFPGIFPVVLSKNADVPKGMVRISPPEASAEVPSPFWIDRYEVTNRSFQQFVDAGGYEQERYWTQPFVDGEASVSWTEAMKRFVDQTGHSGPATWTDGRFLPGEELHPVRGISWYEAAAYAEFVGKSLPTIHHWHAAASLDRKFDRGKGIVPLSNFGGQGPAPVGSYRGIGLFNVYDMAGNVAEWCFNATDEGKRCCRGGAWDTPEYMFGAVDFDSAFARLPRYGFRCVKYVEAPPPAALLAKTRPRGRDFEAEEPASAEDLQAYMRQYLYDKELPLNADAVVKVELKEHYRHERVRIDAAYDGEKFDIHLFLPRHRQLPYQTIVLFPDVGAQQHARFEDHHERVYFFRNVIGLVEQGWALCWPVYKGTFERAVADPQFFQHSIVGRDHYIRIAKDLSRTVDYLETRHDVDSARLAYVGSSWGALIGSVMVVVEPRFKAAVFLAGGLGGQPLMPDVDAFKFAPHVTIPVLMINGKYDLWFPHDASQMPLFRYLGSGDKMIKQFDSGHVTPPVETIQAADAWLRERLRTEAAVRAGEVSPSAE